MNIGRLLITGFIGLSILIVAVLLTFFMNDMKKTTGRINAEFVSTIEFVHEQNKAMLDRPEDGSQGTVFPITYASITASLNSIPVATVTIATGVRILPSCSPNLNLIERLWKFVKKKCLYNIYYETFADLTSGINNCLSRVETDYKAELDTLM